MQSQGRLQKQEAGHVEQLAKLEQQITQHQKMLQDVRSKLEVVNDEVCALRVLVADPSVLSVPRPSLLRSTLRIPLLLMWICLILFTRTRKRPMTRAWKLVVNLRMSGGLFAGPDGIFIAYYAVPGS